MRHCLNDNIVKRKERQQKLNPSAALLLYIMIETLLFDFYGLFFPLVSSALLIVDGWYPVRITSRFDVRKRPKAN